MEVKQFFDYLTYDRLKLQYQKKGYRFFDRGDYNVNVFGFRLTVGTNEWDDVIGVAYKKDGQKFVKMYKGTTDPGLYWLEKLMNEDGCAIMVPDQYRGCYAIGPHGKTMYTALRQKGNIKVYRDGDLDKEHDMDADTIQDDNFYTNLHHGWDSEEVGPNSAGCQVIQKRSDFEEFMSICHNASAVWGNSFTYTLFGLDSVNM